MKDYKIKIVLMLICVVFSGCYDRSKSIAMKYFPKKEALLIDAAEKANVAKMESLVKQGANPNYIIHWVGSRYMTPLLWMIERKTQNISAVDALLKVGANPNLITPDGASPVIMAAMAEGDKSTLVLKILLDHGGNPNIEDPQTSQSPLFVAAVTNNENLKLLISYGAKLEKKNSWGGDTVLLEAASLNDFKLVAFLIEKGANIYAANNQGYTLTKYIEDNYRDLPKADYWRDKVKKMLIERGIKFDK